MQSLITCGKSFKKKYAGLSFIDAVQVQMVGRAVKILEKFPSPASVEQHSV